MQVISIHSLITVIDFRLVRSDKLLCIGTNPPFFITDFVRKKMNNISKSWSNIFRENKHSGKEKIFCLNNCQFSYFPYFSTHCSLKDFFGKSNLLLPFVQGDATMFMNFVFTLPFTIFIQLLLSIAVLQPFQITFSAIGAKPFKDAS